MALEVVKLRIQLHWARSTTQVSRGCQHALSGRDMTKVLDRRLPPGAGLGSALAGTRSDIVGSVWAGQAQESGKQTDKGLCKRLDQERPGLGGKVKAGAPKASRGKQWLLLLRYGAKRSEGWVWAV